ncbi:lytic transglycosylase domain-containing protein [Nocardia sp. NPDC052566]|uniref:aggregation-promoting factor C-terminal-like domain-containing protein n=1 Tax=Nocardia sp. NPDC052566 TaxID=3364330 RepID=UPI0037C92053
MLISRIFSAVAVAACALSLCAAPAAAVEQDELDVRGATAESALAILGSARLSIKVLAMTIVPPSQFRSFDNIITSESGWDVFALNPVSGAYGLGQALPPEKMASHGLDWPFNPVTQIRWAYDYMNARYGSPDAAWAFWQRYHWY